LALAATLRARVAAALAQFEQGVEDHDVAAGEAFLVDFLAWRVASSGPDGVNVSRFVFLEKIKYIWIETDISPD